MQIVASFKFEPITLARLDCIPTPTHGNEKNDFHNLEIKVIL
jgi:hypothetical protein